MVIDRAASSSEPNQWLPSAFGACKPSSWMLSSAIADLEERMKALVLGSPEEDDGSGDTFAERVESYYRKRPQLLALLQDLHNAYSSLADRYSQTIAKHRRLHHHRRSSSSQLSTVTLDHGDCSGIDSDAESSLSFQTPVPQPGRGVDGDAVVAELVMKCVECDLMADEIAEAERRNGESGRKIELQRSLLEVLEAERLVLLTENARLGYRTGTLAEENAVLKRKAAELARCVLRMREDHRVFMLGRKIEDLQAQVRGLEKRNREYSEMLLLKGSYFKDSKRKKKKEAMNENGGGDAVVLDLLCFPAEKPRATKRNPTDEANGGGNVSVGGGRRTGKWWEWLRKNLDMFQCVPRAEFP